MAVSEFEENPNEETKIERDTRDRLRAWGKILSDLKEKIPDIQSREELVDFWKDISQNSNVDEILRLLRESFDKPSHRYAALAFAEEVLANGGAPPGNPGLGNALRQAKKRFEKEEGTTVRASLNIARDATKAAGGDLGKAEHLQSLYYREVFPEPNLSRAFDAVFGSGKQGDPEKNIHFLIQALGSDIDTEQVTDDLGLLGPSMNLAHLKTVRENVYQLQALLSVMEHARQSFDSLNESFGGVNPHAAEKCVTGLLSLVEQPGAGYVGPENFSELLRSLGMGGSPLTQQMRALHEVNGILGNVPDKIFSSIEQRSNITQSLRQAQWELGATWEAEDGNQEQMQIVPEGST